MNTQEGTKELYKQMKPDMGVLIIRCTANDKCLLVLCPKPKWHD